MTKSVSLNRSVQTVLCVLLFSVGAVFGQNGDLQNDLNESFGKFKLIRLDTQAARQKIQLRQTLTIPTIDKNYELNLTPHDLRTRTYRAETTSAEGTRALAKSDVTTFKGTIAGEAESQVRLTIDSGKVEGYFLLQ